MLCSNFFNLNASEILKSGQLCFNRDFFECKMIAHIYILCCDLVCVLDQYLKVEISSEISSFGHYTLNNFIFLRYPAFTIFQKTMFESCIIFNIYFFFLFSVGYLGSLYWKIIKMKEKKIKSCHKLQIFHYYW